MFKNIEISNLRGIKYLKIDDFARVNVFVGPNNCGKTTILEALFMMVGMSNPQLAININSFRDLIHTEANDFRFNFRGLNYKNKISLKSFIENSGFRSLDITPIYSKGIVREVSDKKINGTTVPTDISDASEVSDSSIDFDAIGLNYNFKKSQKKYHSELTLEKNLLSVSFDKKYKELLNARFFNANTLYSTLPDRIDKIQRDKKKGLLLEALRKIEPKIVDIALSKTKVVYVDIDIDQMIPINLMGYGFSKACALIANLLILKDGYLFIDEIENGLHHETLAILWNAIIFAATKYNVQIFLSTHSYEALKILLSVVTSNEYDRKDIRLFLTQKIKDNTHKCYKYDFESLKANINGEIEFRGNLLG